MTDLLSKIRKTAMEDVLPVAFAIGVMIMLIYNESKVKVPGDMLRWRGCDVEGVEFTPYYGAEWWEGGIYQSSEPLAWRNGEFCDLWQVRMWGMTSYSVVVMPYYPKNQ